MCVNWFPKRWPSDPKAKLFYLWGLLKCYVCGGFILFCNERVGVCMCGLCNVWARARARACVCVCVCSFVMCGYFVNM